MQVRESRVCRTRTPTLTLESCLESRIGVLEHVCEYESEHAPRTRLGGTDAATTRRPIEWRAIRALGHARRQFLAAFAQPVVAGLVLRRRSDFRILRDHREIKNVPRCVTFMKSANPFSAEVRKSEVSSIRVRPLFSQAIPSSNNSAPPSTGGRMSAVWT